MNLSLFFTQFINGLQTGSIYALVALGYSMVYGIILLLNFAHGDVIMIGAYSLFYALVQFHFHPVLAAIVAVAASTIVGLLIQQIAYRPLLNAPRLSLLITAIAMSFLLQNGAQILFGADAKSLDPLVPGSLQLGSTSISYAAIVTLFVSVLSMIGLTLLVSRSKRGQAMRAVSEDMDAARLMGIDVNRTIAFTFLIGSALAGIGAVLYVSSYPQVSPTMGSMLGLKAFVAAVLGGIGSLPGAMVGGLLIGILEVLASAIGLSIWKDAVVFAILILVLLFKPDGIMGVTRREKV